MNLVKIYNAKDDLEANIITDILKNSDIACHIQDAGAGEYLNIYYGFTVYGKDIYVDESQADIAKALIEEFSQSDPEEFYENSDDFEDSEDIVIPWYRKKEWLVRGMFLMPVVIFVIFAILNVLDLL